ncbi:hypothetical protein B0H16DRAFT_257325 [Mycena metata]|uniref:Uncharacterized protein n=1 Tax=Mycena metata TaxID=1033252 RepID=A0AAD7MPU7_9AGAR|nr:hypothetical protein B0H16DRAFT_257325 [Mycena metata]
MPVIDEDETATTTTTTPSNDQADQEGAPVTALPFPLLMQVPEPFLSDYARHYNVPRNPTLNGRMPSSASAMREVAMKVLAAGGGRGNPPAAPVLETHAAKLVDGVLYMRYRTAAERLDLEEVGAFPIERLGEPVDEYSDDEVEGEAKEELARWKEENLRRYQHPRAEGKGKGKQRDKNEGPQTVPFVFPPEGFEGEQKDFLVAMLADLQREAAYAVTMYTKAQTVLKEAVYDYACIRAEVDVERRGWKHIWKEVARAAGKEAVEDVGLRVEMRLREEVPPDELAEAVEAGDLPDLAKTRWRSRPTPASVPAAAVPRKSVPSPPASRRPAPGPGPIIIPTLPPPVRQNTTFGGNATKFDQGTFLKRRRSTDPGSDDSDDSDGQEGFKARKRSCVSKKANVARAPPPGLAPRSISIPIERLVAPALPNPPTRRATSKRSPGSRSGSRRASPPVPDVSNRPEQRASSRNVPVLSALTAPASGLVALPSPPPASASALFALVPR